MVSGIDDCPCGISLDPAFLTLLGAFGSMFGFSGLASLLGIGFGEGFVLLLRLQRFLLGEFGALS